MSICERLERFYTESRTIFIVMADFTAFVGAVTITLGIGYLRYWLS